MSQESAQAYIARLQSDRQFSSRVANCKDTAARMAFVRQEGFDFTAEEIKEVAGQRQLTEEELQKVAAGGNGTCCFEGSPGEDSLCRDDGGYCYHDFPHCSRISNDCEVLNYYTC